MKRQCVALLLCLPLGGCVYWQKPGVTQQEFEYDKASCIAEAHARLPPAMQSYSVGGGYAAPMYTTCTGGYYTANCITTGGGYTPPTVIPIDMNAGARNAAFDACMYGRGYIKGGQPAAATTPPGAKPSGYRVYSDTEDCASQSGDAAKACWHRQCVSSCEAEGAGYSTCEYRCQ